MVTSSQAQPFSCPQLDRPDWVAAEALGRQRDKGTGVEVVSVLQLSATGLSLPFWD